MGKAKEMNAIGDQPKWTCLEVAVDSGACDSVINPKSVPDITVMPTVDTVEGNDFVSASGDPIPNLGELKIPMITRERTLRGMTFQGAPVSKPLASVKKISQAGHMVIFDEEGSFIYDKTSGEVNMLREGSGDYMMDIWIPPPAVANELGFTRQSP